MKSDDRFARACAYIIVHMALVVGLGFAALTFVGILWCIRQILNAL
jgi:hypothetical protein